MYPRKTTALLATATLACASGTQAFDVNDKLQINALLAGADQCQQVSGVADVDDACRGAVVFQPEVVYTPTDHDEVYVRFGFAGGNGLNEVSPFVLAPWAADLEDDVRDINGSNRSYLLEAWYSHSFALAEDNRVEVTGGIIDPAAYVNTNAYANDEYTQFSNEVFVNSHNAFLPAYDWGGAIAWKLSHWTFTAVGMSVTENDDGNPYNWFAAEIDYRLETALGEGHYRVMYSGTSTAFLDPAGVEEERLEALNLSFDQQLGDVVGVFLRLGWQDEDAAVDYQTLYSGGLDFSGSAWGREADNIGIGYAHLDGGNTGLDGTDAFEAYYRYAFNDYLALTADVQYMRDDYDTGDDVSGWVLGLRAVVEL